MTRTIYFIVDALLLLLLADLFYNAYQAGKDKGRKEVKKHGK